MQQFSRVFLVLLCGAFALCSADPTDVKQQASPLGSAAYVLGPDDQITVRVSDLEEITDRMTRVDPAGDIDLPLAGRVHAAGLSVEQLRTTLASKLSKYVDSPQVTISIQDYKSEPVSILGEVNNPGVHQLRGPKRLVDIISAAGGLKPEAGETVTVTRELRWGSLPVPDSHLDASGQFSVASIGLDGLTKGTNPGANIAVCPNDIISVSRASIVYVIGEVKKAGGFSLQSRNNISLVRALSLAEGLTHEASPKKARILRAQPAGTPGVAPGAVATGAGKEPDETPVDVQMILAGKAPDIQLHPDDILFIPNSMAGSALKRATEAAVQIATGVIIFR